jgi:hypothetical protein
MVKFLYFFDRKYTNGPTNPVDKIDRARQKASRNLFAASAQRRLEPACLSEKIGFDFFSINFLWISAMMTISGDIGLKATERIDLGAWRMCRQ